jgi:hypothetical protein
VATVGTTECWELDALSPSVIDGLIREELEPMVDRAQWATLKMEEARGRSLLQAISKNWSEVEEFLRGRQADEVDE